MMVHQTTCAHNCSLTVAHFNQQSHLHTVWLQYWFKKKKSITFQSPVPNTRTMIPSKYPPQENLPSCTDRDASYLTVQTSFSLIANRLMPPASLQPLEFGSSPMLSLVAPGKNSSVQLKHPKESFQC